MADERIKRRQAILAEEERLAMWRVVRSRFGINPISIAVVSALLFLSAAPPVVSVAAARVPHPRASTARSKQIRSGVREPATAKELKQLTEVLAGIQVSQSALEKQAGDLNLSMQTRMNQLSAEFADSQNRTQLMLEQSKNAIKSTQRWLKSLVLLLVLSLAGVFYVLRRRPRVHEKPVTRKNTVPEMGYDDKIMPRQSGEPANIPAMKQG